MISHKKRGRATSGGPAFEFRAGDQQGEKNWPPPPERKGARAGSQRKVSGGAPAVQRRARQRGPSGAGHNRESASESIGQVCSVGTASLA